MSSHIRHDRREAMSCALDPRALQTRRQLTEALLTLLAESPTDMPTVSELVRKAGVTRSAFYSHFARVAHLAVHVASDFFHATVALDSASRDGGTPDRLATQEALTRFVEHVNEHRTIWMWLLDTAPAQVRQQVTDSFADTIMETLNHTRARPLAPPDRAAHFLAGGIVNVVHHALLEPTAALDKEELIDDLMALMPPWVVKAAPKR